MQNRILGRTGVSVSPLCLGTMMFGPWGNADEADSIRVIQRALDSGINFVDTADVYSGGECERIVGKALTGRRDDVVLATKFFMPMADEPNHRGGSRRWIIRSVEDSPRRLGTDYIDRRPTHRPPTRHGHPHLQPSGWWLAVRPLAEEQCRSAYLGVPTKGAIRHDHRGQPAKARDRRKPGPARRQTGMTPIDLAIAFVINHPAVTAAIIGPRTMEQLESQLSGADVTLSAHVLDRIDELVAPGVTVNPDDISYGEAELTPTARRRNT